MSTPADTVKTLSICQALQAVNMTPKEFLVHFLTSENSELAYRRRFWTTATGGGSTLSLVQCIRDRFLASSDGQARWNDFIRDEVSARPIFEDFYPTFDDGSYA